MSIPYVKLSRGLLPHLGLITKGSSSLVYLFLVLEQDEAGMVDVDEGYIMAVLNLSAATIDRSLSALESVGLIQPVQPRIEGVRSYSLTGDFSRNGAGAPTAQGCKTVLEGGIKIATSKIDSGSSSLSFSKNHKSISSEKDQQLPLPLADKTVLQPDGEDNPYAMFEREKFGELTPFVGDRLGMLIDESGAENVMEALKIAVLANKRSLNYVEGILRRQAAQETLGPAGSRFLSGEFADEIKH